MATRKWRLGARPDRKELTVKRVVQIRKSRRRPRAPVSQAVAGITMALAARYEVMTHDVSSTLVDSDPCMCGRATLVMLVSRTCMTVMSITEMVMLHFRAEESVEEGWTGLRRAQCERWAARAMAAILSAKLTWLSSSGA